MNIEQIRAEYIDHMGDDLMVVNAARTSFGKESDWDHGETTKVVDEDRNVSWQHLDKKLKPEDANLIRYLATGYRTREWDGLLDKIMMDCFNVATCYETKRKKLTDLLHAYKRRAQHWAPFAHPHLSLRMQLPMFLARQFVKHQIGGVWSEESRRYISDEPGVWFPDEWHTRPEDIKQGSDGVITHMTWNDGGDVEQEEIDPIVRELIAQQVHAYMQMVKGGAAPEEARIVLPLNTMTTVIWTGSLLFWSRVCNQRVDSHAQLAAQELGRQIADIVRPRYPVSWAALCGE